MNRRNVLLIFTDQQRWDTIAAGGNPFIKTPNLDRLAREGTRFDAAYTPSPVCVPARCSMHYGQYPLNTGCFENRYDMPADRPSVTDVLTTAGYRTHAIGKRHFTPDANALRGFQTLERQEEIVFNLEDDDYLQYLQENGCEYAIEPHGSRGEAYYIPQPSSVPPKHHPTQWIGDRTVAWLEEKKDDQPFYLFSSFVHPHPPFAPPTPWHKLYRGPDMPLPKLPDSMESLYTHPNRLQNRYKGRDTGRDVALERLIKAYYWASISFVDYQVGRIFQTLEKTGQLDNTLIIFASDHGEFLGDYNCFGKRSFLDSAARIPMICRLPGSFEAGTVCDTPVSLVDIMPTALAAAGASAENMDGENLAAIADGSAERDTVFGHYEGADAGVYMAINKSWKYIWSAADQKEFLFDRIKDPEELRNRAYNVACCDAAQTMRQLLQDHIRTLPGHEEIVDDNGWIAKPPCPLPDDPDAELIVQDPPCFLDRMEIPGYSTTEQGKLHP
ncbi:sulfatase-like hydrolase/transferase [Pontiellaceae bacterium B12227]|nr:sulfatase-like hydrolase/transferase [Pontiellaceae bacterium B12227]